MGRDARVHRGSARRTPRTSCGSSSIRPCSRSDRPAVASTCWEPTDIPVIATDRGGQITYHGPGQVVAYPLLDLRRLGIFVKELVFRLEQAAIQTLESFGADARRVKGAPGVYVPHAASRATDEFTGLAKIAALGIKVTNGRSYHGLALNVGMDLAPFSLINPCGYAKLPAVDMATLDIHVGWNDAAARLAERLQTHLS